MRFDGGKIGGIEFKFKLELSWLTLGLTTASHGRNSIAPHQLSHNALKLSCLKTANLARKAASHVGGPDSLIKFAKSVLRLCHG